MNKRTAFIVTGTLCLWLFVSMGATLPSEAKKTSGNPGIPPKQVAAYIHAIIEADRTIYTSHVVNRLQDQDIIKADEHWEQHNALLLPAQLLQLAGRLVAEKENGIRYRLISLWPIYRRNSPATELERKGLEAVAKNPEQPFTSMVTSGKKKFFQAIYADKAVTKACIDCHNTHPLSPKRDFTLNSTMGGIVITIPLPS